MPVLRWLTVIRPHAALIHNSWFEITPLSHPASDLSDPLKSIRYAFPPPPSCIRLTSSFCEFITSAISAFWFTFQNGYRPRLERSCCCQVGYEMTAIHAHRGERSAFQCLCQNIPQAVASCHPVSRWESYWAPVQDRKLSILPFSASD